MKKRVLLLGDDLGLFLSLFTDVFGYFLFLFLLLYLALLDHEHRVPVGFDDLLVCLFLLFSFFLSGLTRT